MSSAEGDTNAKDRKKSAHWTDVDTDILIRLLLRYKDSGRTADNGFKPEVWQEASDSLQGSTYQGGPKTPDACKSRWQRLQRDYKAAKDLEAVPGFSWDHVGHRLSAAPEVWERAEKQLEAYKYRKIHLPCYDSLTILCPTDTVRLRQRSKPRPSLTASDSSFSMTMASNPGQGPGINGGHGIDDVHALNGHMGVNGQGLHENGMMMWENDVDGEGDFETSFTMPDGSFTLPQKRMYDPPLLSQQQQQISISPREKKSRISTPHRSVQHSPIQSTHGMYLPLGQRSPDDFPTANGNLVDPSMLHSPSGIIQGGGMYGNSNKQGQVQHHQAHQSQNRSERSPHASLSQSQSSQSISSNQTQHNRSQTQPRPLNHPQPHPLPTPLPTGSIPTIPHSHLLSSSPLTAQPYPPPNISPETTMAALTDAQRRTEALIRLQQWETDMKDEDLCEVLKEFENSIAACDTYLAIKRESLRKMWLVSLVRRRKS